MNRSRAHFISTLASILGVSLFAFTSLLAQDPREAAGDAPVRKELEEFRESRRRAHRPSASKRMSKGSKRSASPARPRRR